MTSSTLQGMQARQCGRGLDIHVARRFEVDIWPHSGEVASTRFHYYGRRMGSVLEPPTGLASRVFTKAADASRHHRANKTVPSSCGRFLYHLRHGKDIPAENLAIHVCRHPLTPGPTCFNWDMSSSWNFPPYIETPPVPSPLVKSPPCVWTASKERFSVERLYGVAHFHACPLSLYGV